jgi:hypothetical protein
MGSYDAHIDPGSRRASAPSASLRARATGSSVTEREWVLASAPTFAPVVSGWSAAQPDAFVYGTNEGTGTIRTADRQPAASPSTTASS